MKNPSLRSLGIAAWCISSVTVPPAFSGVTDADWSGLRAAYEAERHAVRETADGHRCANPGQRWSTRFDGRGFTTRPDVGDWSWGLELRSYGFAGHERPVALPEGIHVTGGRVAYEWSATVEEWVVNDRRGLEHGFTVRERPPHGPGPLRFRLAVRGGLHPIPDADGRGVVFEDDDGAAVITYGGLVVFDADGTRRPARLDATSDGLLLTVDDRGAPYPLTIDPIAQQAYLKASAPDTGDQFGFSVSASGDTVVIGAPQEDSGASGVDGDPNDDGTLGAGAAYVFVRTGTTWTQQAYLKASNTGVDDRFGWAVSVSGDTVVVGAPNEDSNATGPNGDQSDDSLSNAGAAYVFVRTGTTWTQQAYLKASNTGFLDGFGWSVSVSDDTIVVGVPSEDSNAIGVNGHQANNNAPNSGAAYVFFRSGASWSQQAYLKASNTGFGDQFADTVAAAGDTVVVGAPSEDSDANGVDGDPSNDNAASAGAAYVFVRSGTSWSQQAYLKASNTGGDDQFGRSVAASDETVVVGAPLEDSDANGVNGNQSDENAPDSGAAYVFVRSGTTWSQQAYVKASHSGGGDGFGRAASVSGDRLLVGATGEDSNATGVNGNPISSGAPNSGAAYAFSRSGTTWSQQAYLKASNTASSDQAGGSVSVSGDTLVMGAIGEDGGAAGVDGDQSDNSAPGSGAAYVFLMPCGAITSFGAGCPGTGGFVPSLTVEGCAAWGGTLRLEIAGGLGGAPALLLVGNTQVSQPIGAGCTLGTPPLVFISGLSLSGSGAGNGMLVLSAPLPPTAPAATLVLQAASGDPVSALGFTVTNGVRLDVE